MDGFEDLNAAVYRAALAAREKYGDEQEAISIVYEKDGKFHFTTPHSAHVKEDKSRTKVKIPKGSARFIVHNHPEGSDFYERFSDEDISVAEKLKLPSAIIFGKDPTIRTFTPGQTTIGRYYDRTRHSVGDEFDISQFAGTMQ